LISAKARDYDPRVGTTVYLAAALFFGHPWLRFACPACPVIGEVDLRTIDRKPGHRLNL
jgi:hypothetical protein